MLDLRLPGGLDAVDTTPRARQSFHMRRGAAPRHVHQLRLVLRRRHAGDGADLRVRHLAALHGGAEARKDGQCLRHPHLLACGAEIDPCAPVQPVGAGAEAGVPPTRVVELAEQDEQVVGGRVQSRGEFSDASPRCSASDARSVERGIATGALFMAARAVIGVIPHRNPVFSDLVGSRRIDERAS